MLLSHVAHLHNVRETASQQSFSMSTWVVRAQESLLARLDQSVMAVRPLSWPGSNHRLEPMSNGRPCQDPQPQTPPYVVQT